MMRGSSLTGATEAHRKSVLTARVGGVVSKVWVREGDVVRAGQALVSFDTEDFRIGYQAFLAKPRPAFVGR